MAPGTVVLVTGASSGIGRAVATRMGRDGAALALLSRTEETLREVADECLVEGARTATVHAADVSDDDAVREAVHDVVERHGRIDVVVNVAGVAAYGRVDEVPADVFDQVVATNVLGLAAVARHVLPLMKERGRGTIVSVGSLLGRVPVPDMSAYVVSKWAARSLVRQLRLETRACPDVHVCELVPGGVDTGIYEQAANYSDRDRQAPFPVSPETVADAAAALLAHPRPSLHVGRFNRAIVAGFVLAPRLYERAVGPLFRLAASQGGSGGKREDAGNVV